MALYDRLRDSVKMVDGETIEPRPTRGGISGFFPPKPVTVPPQKLPTTSIGAPITPPRGYRYGPDGQLVQLTTFDPPRPTEPENFNPTIFGVIPGQTINLGLGLGSVQLPDINLSGVQNYLSNLPQYNLPSTPFDDYLRDQEEREEAQEEKQVDTGLEDTGVSEEVISDVVDLEEAPVMPSPPSVGAIDSVTGEVIPEEDMIFTTMPVGDRVRFVPPQPPATDVVTGEEMPLITPVVDVPQDSMTGLGSYFTAPQIQQIVSPPQQVPGTSDMEKLLQLQRDSFLKFLVQPQVQQPVASPVVTTGPATGGETGYMGTGYVPGETYQPITFGNPYVNPVAEQVQNYMYSQPQNIQFPTNQMFGLPKPLAVARGPLDETRGSYGDVYGGLVFPDFSGITSLVPFDARQQII